MFLICFFILIQYVIKKIVKLKAKQLNFNIFIKYLVYEIYLFNFDNYSTLNIFFDMKKITITACFFAVFFILSAQDKTLEIDLKGDKLTDIIDLQENGFLIKTGADIRYTKQNIILRHYSPTLDLKWEVPIERMEAAMINNLVIRSNTGKTIYNIEYTGVNMYGTNYSGLCITSIDQKGQKKIDNVSLKEIYKTYKISYMYTAFATDNQLYFLVNSSIAKEEINYIIVYNASTKTTSIKKIDTYDLSQKFISSTGKKYYAIEPYFQFLKVDDNSIYIAGVFSENSNTRYKVFKLDLEGKLVKTSEFAIERTKEFTQLAANKHNYNTGEIPKMNNNEWIYRTSSRYLENSTLRYKAADTAHCGVQVSYTDNSFYIYGLSADVTERNSYDLYEYNGIYILKYSFDGKLLASFKSKDFPEISTSFFQRKTSKYLNHIGLFPGPNNTLLLKYWHLNYMRVINLGTDLKLLNYTPIDELYYNVVTCFYQAEVSMPKNITLKFQPFWKKMSTSDSKNMFNESKQFYYKYMYLPKSSVIIKLTKNYDKCMLYYFKEEM